MMMSFARGKVSEAAARLALAQGMIKVAKKRTIVLILIGFDGLLQEMEEYCVDSSAFCQHTCEKVCVAMW